MAETVAFEANIEKHEIENFGEECGVFGVFEPGTNVAETTYRGLVTLKHRGQDASGQVVVNEFGDLHLHKDLGSVIDVFDEGVALPFVLPTLGRLAIGHNRYGTMNKVDIKKRWHAAQPILIEENGFRFAGAYNGDVANIHEVMKQHDIEPDAYVSDTEAVMQLLDSYMVVHEQPDLVLALQDVLPQLQGAFSGVFTDGERLIAARDVNGFRPFVYGKTPTGGHVVASEVRALEEVGAVFTNEIEPGTIMAIDNDGVDIISYSEATHTPCSYEYFYFSKEDNIFHEQNVGDVRWRLGQELAKEHPVEDVDLVVGVPNSGIVSAEAYAKTLGLSYEQVILKNKNKQSDMRTFIANNQNEREAIARAKFYIEEDVVLGKSVAIIDDSVIRGTVTRAVIEMLRVAGAAKVHVRVPAPPYKNPCYYGMDTGRVEELLTRGRTHDEMVSFIGADSLEFLSPDGVHRAAQRQLGSLCVGCSTGVYPTDIPVSITV